MNKLDRAAADAIRNEDIATREYVKAIGAGATADAIDLATDEDDYVIWAVRADEHMNRSMTAVRRVSDAAQMAGLVSSARELRSHSLGIARASDMTLLIEHARKLRTEIVERADRR